MPGSSGRLAELVKDGRRRLRLAFRERHVLVRDGAVVLQFVLSPRLQAGLAVGAAIAAATLLLAAGRLYFGDALLAAAEARGDRLEREVARREESHATELARETAEFRERVASLSRESDARAAALGEAQAALAARDQELARLAERLEGARDLQAALVARLEPGARTEIEKLSARLAPTGIPPATIAERAAEDFKVGDLPDPRRLADAAGADMARLAGILTRLDKLKLGLAAMPFGKPTDKVELSSRFGARMDPFTGEAARHEGLDLSNTVGAPVYATAAGVVTMAGPDGNYGRLVEVRHPLGLSTRFGHLARIDVRIGQTVAAGTRLGVVGTSGRSTGPHLHYEVRLDERPRDPFPFLEVSTHEAAK